MDKFPQLLKLLLSKAAGATQGIGTQGANALGPATALVGLGAGVYGLYHSVVTGR